MVLGEQLLREVDDGAGDALGRVRPGLRPDPQRGHEDAPEGLQGEGVLARLAGLRAGQRGDRDDDPRRGVDEQFGHPRFSAGELAGGVDIVGLDGPEVAEGADGRGRGHRGEWRGVGHVGSSTYGPPLIVAASNLMLGVLPCGQSPAPTEEGSPPCDGQR